MGWRHRRATRAALLSATFLTAVSGILVAPESAFAAGALPSGGQYVAGKGSIAGASSALTVKQSSTTGIVDWSSFSIGKGNTVTFDNGSGATLNRVTGANISNIAGSLNATGSVYLMNPEGVVIGAGGKVVTGGDFAVTTDIGNDKHGSIVDAGHITSQRGSVSLSGANVGVSGIITVNRGGHIWLTSTNATSISGSLNADNASGAGGSIVATGKTVSVAGTANVSASGKTGGTILIGGDVHGGAIAADNFIKQSVSDATTTTIGKGAKISADGSAGAGGDIVVWSNGQTTYQGAISATGKTAGGFAEVSSRDVLAFTGTADLLSANDKTGTLLLDPENVTISTAASSTDTCSSGTCTPTGNNSVLNVPTLQNALASANVDVTTGSSGSQTGDITVASAVTWSSSSVLTLAAYHSVFVEAPINITGAGGLKLKTDDGGTGGVYTITNGGQVNYGAVDNGGTLTINGSPYTLIYSMSELQAINASNTSLQGDYALATPLNAVSTTSWVAIGTIGTTSGTVLNSGHGFSGTFEGLGNTIDDLTIDRSSLPYLGLFGYSSGTIRDVGRIGGSTTGSLEVGGLVGDNKGEIIDSFNTGTVSGGDSIGGLVGGNDGTMTGDFATGAVSVSSQAAGGLVGINTGTIMDSYASGAVSGPNTIGGLVGDSEGTIDQAYATGSVRGTGTSADVGGLVGSSDLGATVNESYEMGAVSGSENVGGIAGFNFGTISNSYWGTQTSGQSVGVGSGNASDVTGLTTAQLTSALPTGFSSSVWGNVDNQTTPYLLALTSNPQKVYLGSNSTHVFNLVFTMAQVQAINASSATLSVNYALANSLDATSTASWTPLGTDGAGDVLNSSKGFSGIFDGLGNTISNLAVNIGADSYAGLFGYSSGTIRNIGMLGGSVSGGAQVGGLVGADYGAISDSYATGTASGDMDTGGLAGFSNGAISNSYAAGTVSGTQYVGGLVGADQGTISGSYATGAVSGTSGVGGLSGSNTGSISDSYWDKQTTGQATSAGSPAGDGLTTAQLSAALPTGFSSSVWGNVNNQTTPYLLALTSSPQTVYVSAISATASFSLLFTLAQVQAINATDSSLDGNYALANSLNAASTSNWIPIGTDGNGNVLNTYAGFKGTFTGLGNTVSNLDVVQGNNQFAGLFGVSSGTLRDIGIMGGSDSGADYVGGLVGYSSGTVSNSYSTASITGTATNGDFSTEVGGLVGGSTGTIANSYATGSVNGGPNSQKVGGLAGVADTVTNSHATGNVVGGNDVGGLVGSASAGTITGSYATGSASANGSVGGLVGDNSGEITNSYASGPVSGGAGGIIGGLVGINNSAIDYSFATGAVSAPTGTGVGGLVGENYYGSIDASYATGSISGSSDVGGLVGQDEFAATVSTVTDSYSVGGVKGTTNAGGLIGQLISLNTSPFPVFNSYWDKQTSGQSTSADGTGLMTTQLQGALPFGFSSIVWGTGSGLYPYLLWQFTSGTPQAISGTISSAGAIVVGQTMNVVANGVVADAAVSMSSGADGYYYLLFAPDTFLASGSHVVVYDSDGSAFTGASFVENVTGSMSGVNLANHTLGETASATNYSKVESDFATAIGSDSAAQTLADGLTSLSITASAPTFTVNAPIDESKGSITIDASNIVIDSTVDAPVAGSEVTLNSEGSMTEMAAGAIDAPKLTGTSVGGASLTGSNDITDLESFTNTTSGSFRLTDADALTVAGAVSSTGDVVLTTTGAGHSLAIDNGITAGNEVILTSAATLVEAGSGVVDALELSGSSVGGATLNGANGISDLEAFTNATSGSFALTDTDSLTVAQPLSSTGNVTLTTTGSGHGLSIRSTLTAANEAVLDSAGTLGESGGAIDAHALLGSSSGTTSLAGANDIADLSTFSTSGGSFTLVDDASLTTTGTVNTGAGTLDITTGSGDGLAVDGAVETSGTMNLVTGAEATENTSTGSIKAAILNVTAQTGINLASTHNSITKIGTDKTTSGPNVISQN